MGLSIVFPIAILLALAVRCQQQLIVEPSRIELKGVDRCTTRRLVIMLQFLENSSHGGSPRMTQVDRSDRNGPAGRAVLLVSDSPWLVISDLANRVRVGSDSRTRAIVYAQPLSQVSHAVGHVTFVDVATGATLGSTRVDLDLAPDSPSGSPDRPDAPPSLSVAPEEIDLGEITVGEMYEQEIVLSNRSRLPINVAASNQGCGTRVVSVLPDEIPAGDSRSVQIVVQVSQTLGVLEDGVVIRTREPLERSYWVPIRGTIHACGVLVNPETLVSRQPVRPGERLGRVTLSVPEQDGSEMECRPSSPAIELSLEPQEVGGYQWLVCSVASASDLSPGPHGESISIFKRGEIVARIPVVFEIIDAVSIRPSRARFGVIEPSETVEVGCSVSGQYLEDVVVREIHVSCGPRPSVRVEHDEGGWHVALSFQSGEGGLSSWQGVLGGWVRLDCRPDGIRRLPWSGFVGGRREDARHADGR